MRVIFIHKMMEHAINQKTKKIFIIILYRVIKHDKMKVTRKVARRSRSSVSRRRLRNKKTKSFYRKKHANTQRGGKRGRGQKRVRVHTHKRGRRFHRGGVKLTLAEKFFYPSKDHEREKNDKNIRKEKTDYATITDPLELNTKLNYKFNWNYTDMTLYIYFPTFTDEKRYDPTITLRCKKLTYNGNKTSIFPALNQKFSCHISYSKDKDGTLKVYVSFYREDNMDIGFSFDGAPEIIAPELRTLDKLKEKIATRGPSGKDTGETYSFNFNENQAMFNAIADAIEKYEDTAKNSVSKPPLTDEEWKQQQEQITQQWDKDREQEQQQQQPSQQPQSDLIIPQQQKPSQQQQQHSTNKSKPDLIVPHQNASSSLIDAPPPGSYAAPPHGSDAADANGSNPDN
jgi:hypothetical protein